MINETLLVKQYLNGENINEGIMYRICYLLSKWYKENGINSKLEIRNNIFNWAKENNVYIKINLNDCIDRATKNKRRLTGDNQRYGKTGQRIWTYAQRLLCICVRIFPCHDMCNTVLGLEEKGRSGQVRGILCNCSSG